MSIRRTSRATGADGRNPTLVGRLPAAPLDLFVRPYLPPPVLVRGDRGDRRRTVESAAGDGAARRRAQRQQGARQVCTHRPRGGGGRPSFSCRVACADDLGDWTGSRSRSYMFDTLYITWFIHVATALISVKFWYLYWIVGPAQPTPKTMGARRGPRPSDRPDTYRFRCTHCTASRPLRCRTSPRRSQPPSAGTRAARRRAVPPEGSPSLSRRASGKKSCGSEWRRETRGCSRRRCGRLGKGRGGVPLALLCLYRYCRACHPRMPQPWTLVSLLQVAPGTDTRRKGKHSGTMLRFSVHRVRVMYAWGRKARVKTGQPRSRVREGRMTTRQGRSKKDRDMSGWAGAWAR